MCVYIYVFLNFLFKNVFPHFLLHLAVLCCVFAVLQGLSVAVARGVYSLVAVHELPIAVASLVAEHRL